jgi:hypothetical protein
MEERGERRREEGGRRKIDKNEGLPNISGSM